MTIALKHPGGKTFFFDATGAVARSFARQQGSDPDPSFEFWSLGEPPAQPAELTQSADPTVTLADPITATSVTVNGITFNFSESKTVYFDPVGWPMTVSPVTITSITPASDAPEGTRGYVNKDDAAPRPAAPLRRHGTVINPVFSDTQGWDETAHWTDANSGKTASKWDYDPALNADPGATGNPIVFTAGQTGSVCKSKRLDGIVNVGSWHVMEKMVPLTVLASPPAPGDWAPSPWGDNVKAPTFNISDVDWSVFRRLDIFNASYVTPTVGGQNRIQRTMLPTGGAAGERLRRLNIPVSGDSTYVGNPGGLSDQRMLGLIACHDDRTLQDKHMDILWALRHGLDLCGAKLNGGMNGNRGAGQHHGYLPFMYTAAFAFQSSSLLAAAQTCRANCVDQFGWITPSQIGQRTEWPGGGLSDDAAQYYKTYFEEDTYKPSWFMRTPASQNIAGHLYARYKANYQPSLVENAAIILLKNGPGGINGWDAIRNGPMDFTNDRAAVMWAIDRLVTWSTGTDQSPISDTRNLWGQVYPFAGIARWEGTPDHSPDKDISVTGGDGFIRLNSASDLGGARPSVTQTDVRYSNDGGVTWTEVLDYTLDSNITVPNGYSYLLQTRQRNAKGIGPWSTNVKLNRGTVTPPGRAVTTGAASGSYDFSPKLAYRPYSSWAGDYFEELTTPFPAGVYQVYCGLGLRTGTPPSETAADPVYAWKINGVTQADMGTGRSVWLSEVHEGQSLTCEVTHGGVTKTTAAITLPSEVLAPPNPPGVQINADFTNRLNPIVSDFIDSLLDPTYNQDGTAVWDPGIFGQDYASPGAVILKKNGQEPRLKGYMDLSSLIGTEIQVWVSVAVVASSQGNKEFGTWGNPIPAADTRPGIFLHMYPLPNEVGQVPIPAGPVIFASLEENGDKKLPNVAIRLTEPFTVTAEAPYLRVYVVNNVGSGGEAGGNPNLCDVRVCTPGAFEKPWIVEAVEGDAEEP